MSNNFLPEWQRLLIARSVAVAGEPAILATYWFPVLEAAIETFRDDGTTAEEKEALKRAYERVQAKALRLSYEAIVSETPPWISSKATAKTWHDALPLGLLVLSGETFVSVDKLQGAKAAELNTAWTQLQILFEVLIRLIKQATGPNKPWTKPWINQVQLSLNLPAARPGDDKRLLCWSAMDFSDASLGRWVIPALMDTAVLARAALEVPEPLARELPGFGKIGSMFVDDPRSLTALTRDVKFEIRAQTQEVAINLPWFVGPPDELSLAAALLDSYRFSTEVAAVPADQVSIWDAALTLDPPATEQSRLSRNIGQWPVALATRRKLFRDRLKELADRRIGGFAELSLEMLTAACWVRRFSQIAYAGLAYPGAGGQKPVQPIVGAPAPSKSGVAPSATDAAADTAFKSLSRITPIDTASECAFYLGMRFGNLTSSSSARSLQLLEGPETTLGVSSLLESPELVYTEIARQIAEHFSDASDPKRIANLSVWLSGNVADERASARSSVSLAVVKLGASPVEPIESGAGGRKIAKIVVSGAPSALKDPSSHRALVKALVKAYERPPVGGMPAFIANLVSNDIGVSSDPYNDPGEDSYVGEEPPEGLIRLLSRGFDKNLSARIHKRAQLRKITTLRGARDIVRMGRGAFISRLADETKEEKKEKLSPDLLSRVYSRAWSKANVRAQFIARLRPTDSTTEAGSETPKKETDPLPDLATLFDLTELPACSWGDSIHGPAAYMADTLEFLRHRRLISKDPPVDNTEPKSISALNLLLQRRPDLAEVDLNDKNATVEMPFIDLVNEVLERHVAESKAFKLDIDLEWAASGAALGEEQVEALQTALQPWGIHLALPILPSAVPQTAEADHACRKDEWMLRDRNGVAVRVWRHHDEKNPESRQARLVPQTTLTAEALAAEPQYVERRAYQKLAEKSVLGSFCLPWSLGEAALGSWLERVGIAVSDVLRAERPDHELASDMERLARSLAHLGIPQTVGAVCIFSTGTDHLLFDSTRDRKGKPEVSLQKFLERSGLSYAEFVLLTQMHAGRAVGLARIENPENPCNADTRAIRVNCEASDGFSRLAKLLRLRRYLEWSLTDLDLAWLAPNLGNKAMDASFAHKLALLLTVAGRLELTIGAALRIFTRLRTTAVGDAAEGEWARVFLNPRSNGADVFRDAAALRLLKTLSSGPECTIGQLLDPIAEGRVAVQDRLQAFIAAAVGVPATDLQTLFDVRHPGIGHWTTCSREMLSQTFGAAVLMRALRVTPAVLGSLVSLLEGNPFVNPAATLQLLDLRQHLEEAGLPAEALQACLTQEPDDAKQPPVLPALYRRATVMGSVLAIFQALKSGSTAQDVAVLLSGPTTESKAPQEWLKYLQSTDPEWLRYLQLTDAALTLDAPWAQRLNLLREPVRRLLPLIQSDLPRLRRDQIKLHPMAGRDPCATRDVLLVEALGKLDDLLAQALLEVPSAVGKPIAAGQDLLNDKVKNWIVGLFAPVLQWIGLTREEISERLSPWVDSKGAAGATPAVAAPANWIAGAADAQAAVELASFVLCRPLERFALRKARKSAIADALSSSISATPELAWALLEAIVPQGAARAADTSAAEWWLCFDAYRAAAAWEGPVFLALEQMTSVEPLKTAYEHTRAVHRSWCVMGGLGLSAMDVQWLSQRPSESASNCRGRLLTALVPQDLLAPPGKSERHQRAELANRWCRLAGWAKTFARLADVVNPVTPDMPWSLKRGVIDALLTQPDLQKVDEPESVEETTRKNAAWRSIMESLQMVGSWSLSGVVRLLDRMRASLFLIPETYDWLMEADETLIKAGVPPEQLALIAKVLASPNEESRQSASANLRSSLRKRFAEANWLTASKQVNDRLRGLKRDALVDSLLARSEQPWSALDGSKDRLYERLLLDTQMAACMTTSRIVQAHAAIQQFAQRCTMGLESGWQIPIGELEDWKQWTWMRNYRVWEACRKIFLYPENWMEPEIRDDKSRFFEELENDLNQGELTNENAESALVRYLHKLHDVARLQVLTTYYEFDADRPVMHVLGRTPSQPYRYFYRQWIDERSWTPWDPVDLEIESNQVVLFKRGGRLYLGWMTAIHDEQPPEMSKSVTIEQSASTYTVRGAEEATVRWKLQLTTSQRTREGWEAKRTGQGNLAWPSDEFVSISALSDLFRVDELQLVFQDYGVPEILVLSVGEDKAHKTNAQKTLIGSFSLASCLGIAVPQAVRDGPGAHPDIYPMVAGARFEGFRYVEGPTRTDAELELVEGASNDGNAPSASGVPSLLKLPPPGIDQTPGQFSVTIASQASLLDLALATARAALVPTSKLLPMTMGLGLPIFYADDSVDLAVRINFTKAAEVGGEVPFLSSRTVARVLGSLRQTVESDAIQNKIWGTVPRNDDWAVGVLKAIQELSPAASTSSIYGVVKSVSDAYPDSGKQTFELAARTHHPVACDLVNRAEGRGVTNIFSQRVQMQLSAEVYRGRSATWLSDAAISRFPKFALSFDPERDAYACYNWEVFFHAPFLIAMKFASEGKFEDAIQWFHCIFDPVGVPDETIANKADPRRRSYWKTQPFRTEARGTPPSQRIDVLLDPSRWKSDEVASALQELVDSVMEWRRKPNLPFQVGRGRWVAFQKAIVYRYIDTIIAWGDARFRIDTREEITAASQLYVLAGRLLGRRPRTDVSVCGKSTGDKACGDRNYEQLKQLIDKRDDQLSTQLDTLFNDVSDILDCSENEEPDSPHINFYNEYFCIPHNENLFELWDRVADRQYKVRNCLNIDGVYRIPSLFAPPIDPALLARAGAAGLSLDQIVAGLNQPRSHYRFSVMLQKANEVAAELRTLGGELLQALEKRDAEELALLRSRLDLQVARLSRETRELQIKEAETQLQALAVQRSTALLRRDWYIERVAKDVSPKERESIEGIRSGLLVRTRVAAMKSSAAIASLIPKYTLGGNGAFGSPHFALTIAGELFATSQNFFADKLAVEGDKDQTAAGITGTLASYERRREEWEFQRDLAKGEIDNIAKQFVAAEIRLAIAVAEKRNLEKSIENSEATDEFLKSKFTNSGLYDWMVRQISSVYYKTYQMAVDYARAAEDCLNRELPLSASGVKVIRADHWNGLRKGLLAASSLIHDLKRLESEQITRNRRVPELTKHVSLAMVDPVALLELRTKGTCSFKIHEALFDLDHPGQFARRVKSVALTVPCISGPFTSVNCKLALTGSDIRRRDPSQSGSSVERGQYPVEVVFTSSGSADTGLWEPNLRDDRYLPFEGAGAVNSEWSVWLPQTVRQFDYTSISDLVLQIKYTAEPSSNSEVAEKNLAAMLSSTKGEAGIKVFTSLRDDLADQFSALLDRTDGKPVKLRLPTGLARWMGRPIVSTGKLKIVVLGESAGTPAVSVGKVKGELVTEDSTSAYSFRQADLDVEPEILFAQEGFEFSLAGMTSVKDVLLFVDGATGPR
ncbi:neuraminidase-like domain-containing protein [Nevskia ramosa]|uniref:Tc toxin subunit A-related protein n=1 Tax=Nevskia ramosa TaxID=64002 RepID=UPI00235765D4|nr:neuraminidase-like domain-containing protein [Nevskia ramosa]